MNPDILNPSSYWSKIYTYTEYDLQLIENEIEGKNQSITNLVILNRTRLNDEFRFLIALESVGRQIYSKECISHLNIKDGLTEIVYEAEFKKLVRETVRQSFKFDNLTATSIGRLTGKEFSPYVQAVIEEIYSFQQIQPSISVHEVIDDLPLDDVVKKVYQRLRKSFQKHIRHLEYDVVDQLSSYFGYVSSLIERYGDLRWIKISLHADLLEALEINDGLNLIGKLSRSLCGKIVRDAVLFADCTGYICSLNTMSSEHLYTDVILFFQIKDESFDFKTVQFNAISLWHSHFTHQQPADVKFKCSLQVYSDPECTIIKQQDVARSQLPRTFERMLVNLVARHQLVGSKAIANKRVKLVTRGEIPRSARLRRSNHA